MWAKLPTYTVNRSGCIRNILAITWRVLDVVIGSSFHPYAAVARALLARRYGLPFVFEVLGIIDCNRLPNSEQRLALA